MESEQDEVHTGGKDEAARGEIPEGPAQSVESECEKEKGVDLGTAMAHFRNEQTAADVVEEEIPTLVIRGRHLQCRTIDQGHNTVENEKNEDGCEMKHKEEKIQFVRTPVLRITIKENADSQRQPAGRH